MGGQDRWSGGRRPDERLGVRPVGGWAGRHDDVRGAVVDLSVDETTLHVALLGRLAIRTSRGADVRLLGRHAQALFSLLVLTRRPRTREAIAADLWPESAAIARSTSPL